MVLVTGGTGLIGSHLLLRLLKQNISVRALYRKKSRIDGVLRVFEYYEENASTLLQKVEWVQGDITDIPSLKPVFEGVDHVYHCAALISFDPDDFGQLQKINIEGTANIVNLCLANDIAKLCYISSIAALGPGITKTPIDEQNEWSDKNASVYALTKHQAELEVWRGTQEGLAAVIVNPGVVFGPGFWKGGSGTFFYQAAKAYKKTVPGGTGFVSVEDVVSAMTGLMKAKVENERFILVEENSSFIKIMRRIAQAMDKNPPHDTFGQTALEVFWRLDWLRAHLFKKSRRLSKNMARSLLQRDFYDSSKIKDTLGMDLKNLDTTINFTAKKFIEDFPQLF